MTDSGRDRDRYSDFEEAQEELDAEALAVKLYRARRERDASNRALKAAEIELSKMRKMLDVVDTALEQRPAPKWLKPPARPKRGVHRATVATIASDWHFDEVVALEEIDFMNKYNREIARMRLTRYFEKLVELPRDHLAGLTYDGLVFMLGGDILSGQIHDELTQTNEDTVIGSAVYWSDELAIGIRMMADVYGKVHVPVVVGNHPRMTRKPRSKMRARDNFDWLIGQMLMRTFKNDPEITFDVSDSTDAHIPIYNTPHLLTHGDQVNGGSGVGGIWPPIMRMHARKTVRQSSTGKPYDVLVMGHWHQLIMAPSAGLIVNGAGKGYDEYAYTNNFPPEVAQQGLWVVTPEHGVTWSGPVLVADPVAEGWG